MQNSPQKATAAVAIIKSETPVESYLILRRANHPCDPWSGHFSFPGGRREQQDQSLLETCIRETSEEAGIRLEPGMMHVKLQVTPAGRESKSPVWVQPYIFVLPQQPEIHLDTREIQSACWLNSEDFLKSKKHKSVELLPGLFFPAFPLEDYYLWGFTYRLLQSVLNV